MLERVVYEFQETVSNGLRVSETRVKNSKGRTSVRKRCQLTLGFDTRDECQETVSTDPAS